MRQWVRALCGSVNEDSEFHRQIMGRKQICDSQMLAQLVADGGLRDFPASFISCVI